MKDRFQRFLVKLMLVLATMEVILTWLAQLLRHLTTFQLVLIGAAISCIAYFVRERRRPRREPRISSRGERTPVMPRRADS